MHICVYMHGVEHRAADLHGLGERVDALEVGAPERGEQRVEHAQRVVREVDGDDARVAREGDGQVAPRLRLEARVREVELGDRDVVPAGEDRKGEAKGGWGRAKPRDGRRYLSTPASSR